MFQLDQVLEYWATKYKPISHSPLAAAAVEDKRFFRIQEIDLQSEWSRNMNKIDHPCLLFRMAEDGSVNNENINRLDRFWGLYLAVKQEGLPNNVVDELGAADCKRDLMKMTAALLAWLTRLQTWASNGRTDVSNPFFSLADRETREGLRGLRMQKTAFWTTPMHLNGWWLMGIELYGIDPRPLCVNDQDYLPDVWFRPRMNNHDMCMMMLAVDGVLSQYAATPTDLLAAAQAIATSAIGDLVNKSHQPSSVNPQTSSISPQTSESLHRFADLAADQIRAALHARIDEGPKPDW